MINFTHPHRPAPLHNPFTGKINYRHPKRA